MGRGFNYATCLEGALVCMDTENQRVYIKELVLNTS